MQLMWDCLPSQYQSGLLFTNLHLFTQLGRGAMSDGVRGGLRVDFYNLSSRGGKSSEERPSIFWVSVRTCAVQRADI